MKKSTRLKVCLNHQYLQGSWNFERMQNGGWCYGLLPALKELYPNKEDYDLAVERHLKFYNTHPYVSAPIVGIVLAMEEEKAKGSDISDTSRQVTLPKCMKAEYIPLWKPLLPGFRQSWFRQRLRN